MEICDECGAWAPQGAKTCGSCGADPLERSRGAHQDPRCVQVRLTFECRGCALPAPLDRLAHDGVVVCCRCGLRQGLDPSDLSALLRKAWGIADLWHPDAEGDRPGTVSVGAVNPYREPSLPGRTFDGRPELPRALTAWLGRGIPLDDADRSPMLIEVEERGHITTSTGARYATDPEGLALCPGLVGVVADEHRVDDAALGLAEAEEGEAFACARCGAALPVDGTLRLVRCTYCDAVHHIPADLRHRLRDDPVPDVWWLVFDGPSPLRQELETDPPGTRTMESVTDAPLSRTRKVIDLGMALVIPTVLLLAAGVIVRGSWWILHLAGVW